MNISRREFVGSATTSVGGWCLFGASRWKAPRRSFDLERDATLISILDAGVGCVLRESLLGYQAALVELAVSDSRVNISSQNQRTTIVPGIGVLDSDLVLRLLEGSLRSWFWLFAV